jgi:hypothetical protein
MFKKILLFFVLFGMIFCFGNLLLAQDQEQKVNKFEEFRKELERLEVEYREAERAGDENKTRHILQEKKNIEWQRMKYMRSQLTLSIEADKDIYTYAEPIVITARWTNSSQDDVFVTDCDVTIYNYQVIDKTGKKLRNYKRAMRRNSGCFEFVIEPYNSYEYNLDISDRFKFKPGEYYIRPVEAETRYYSEPVNTVKIKVEPLMK